MTAATHPPMRSARHADPAPIGERLTGIEALARVLQEQAAADERAGLTTGGFASGYPGSPIGHLHDVLEERTAELAAQRIVHSPGLNEELSATAVWGSQTVAAAPGATVDGVFGMWYGKAPGVDRAGDALRHGNIHGVAPHGGVLVVAGDDPRPNATMYPSDSNLAFHAWGMPILFPGTAQEVLDLGLHGYALSRASGLWIGFKMVTSVADGTGTVVMSPDRITPVLPTLLVHGVPFVPRLRVNEGNVLMLDAERELFAERRRLAELYILDNRLNPVVIDSAEARVGIVGVGKTFHDLRQAFAKLGLDDDELSRLGIRVKHVTAPYPIAPEEWTEFADGLDEIIVVEEKRPLVETAVKDALYAAPRRPLLFGKREPDGTEFLPVQGELSIDMIARRVGSRLQQRFEVPTITAFLDRKRMPVTLLPMTTSRTGFFCSGCPHNTGLNAPTDSVVAAGIGCHLIGLYTGRPEHGHISGYTQMGGEGAQWVGMAPFTTTEHLIQNVGDGTFHHSASLAVRLAIASDVNITFKVLYNGTVGMTGGQDVRGGMTVGAMARSLLAEGVRKVVVTADDPKRYRRGDLPRGVKVLHRDRIVEAQEELAEIRGVTVLIHDQICATVKRRELRRAGKIPTMRVMINERVCEACGDCSAKSQCLSVQPVETDFGRKTTIDQSSCNWDYSCVKGDCPSFLVVETKGAAAQRRRHPQPPEVPEPDAVVRRDSFSVHMTGIGGSGVISVSQMLGAAAAIEGKQVRSLDLTGGTIKAGPVVSQLQVYPGGEPPAAGIADGDADLFLAFDLLAAMTPANLAPASSERTVAVASSSIVPTGQMAMDPSVPYPSVRELRATLDGVTRPAHNVYLDVAALAKALFGNHLAANVLLVGAAFQAGALPLRAESIEQAIREQGIAVDQNVAAFRWGRALIADPDAAERLGVATPGPRQVDAVAAALIAEVGAGDELAALLQVRVPDLIGYQDRAYARRYVEVVARVAAADRALGRNELSLTVARNLHRLMAYKDEYEVARLHLLDSSRQAVEAEFGQGVTVSWKLHPPVLRYLGMKRKITVGPWFRPAFVALRTGRKVRGTPLDVFGYAKVRRVERALVDHYAHLVDEMLRAVTADNYTEMCALAAVAEMIRGYEGVKMRNVAAYVEAARPIAAGLGIGFELTGALDAVAAVGASR